MATILKSTGIFLLVILALLTSSCARGECPPIPSIPIKVTVTDDLIEMAQPISTHQPLKSVSVSFAVDVDGYTFQAVEVTYGEVEEFFFPLDYEISDESVSVKFSIAEHYLSKLELVFLYSSGNCQSFTQQLLLP